VFPPPLHSFDFKVLQLTFISVSNRYSEEIKLMYVREGKGSLGYSSVRKD
jgi:hypothetical protein